MLTELGSNFLFFKKINYQNLSILFNKKKSEIIISQWPASILANNNKWKEIEQRTCDFRTLIEGNDANLKIVLLRDLKTLPSQDVKSIRKNQ